MRESTTDLDQYWGEYLKRLEKMSRRRKFLRRLPLLGLSYLALLIMSFTGSWIFAQLDGEGQESSVIEKRQDRRPEPLIKEDLPGLLGDLNLNRTPVTGTFDLRKNGTKLTVETSLDASLQEYTLSLLKRSRALQAAVVVLRPNTGQILAMANYDNREGIEPENLCLRADFPAASLFKIVSAAAVIEERGFTPDRTMVFRGKKHTLYRYQLKEGKGRYSRKTSLRKAFSGSINPVFGKIGIYELGRELLTEFADKFHFNREIPFDLPLARSTITIPEDDFGLAEIASGFNKRTRISPLHATIITGAVANRGTIIRPWLVRRVRDESGKVMFRARLSRLGCPIGEETALRLRELMKDTVLHGTCRKAFRPLRRRKSFRDIALGAKTGTINDPSDRFKFDWLSAYAIPNGGRDGGICITVLSIHGKKLGIRAKDLARCIINHHFTT
jgi:membrane carboxypeptidase/penicillin-binding protein